MNVVAMSNLLFAQASEDGAGRVIYELARLENFDDARLPVAVISIAAAALAGLVWYLYRRDTAEMPRAVSIALFLLRCVALAGLLVYFLGIERRTTREVVHNSQVAVLVDVSQSMGLNDNENAADPQTPNRLGEVVRALADSPLLAELRKTHDVNVARFDRQAEPVVTLTKEEPTRSAGAPVASGERREDERSAPGSVEATGEKNVSVDWSKELEPRGTETRLGQALADQLRAYRGAPLAGVVVITDGAQNAGVEPDAAVVAAREGKVPIFTIGIGSTQARRNVALRDLVVPTRAFPGDALSVTGFIQANGYAGRLIDVELTRRGKEEPDSAAVPIKTERIALGADGEMVPVSFEIEPDAPGSFVLGMRIAAPADDGNPRDNQREAEVDVVDRKTKVLLFAGGPSRDYQFLRGQLFRDRTMVVDVLLQTAQEGISQEANQILDKFPATREELFQYDTIVAFDPDWTQLDAEQIALLESWVGEEAGGLIVVAGPIHTSKWLRSTEHAKLKDLYPVVFQPRLTLLDDGQFGGEMPWPLAFDRAGREAKFLWLAPTAEESEKAWDNFAGVYGYYAVKNEKPGATVYARFSDPEAGVGKDRPVYFASQFYGGGQVFYVGSGELWRLRTVDPAMFEVLYTKLIRHVSQGRILRGSSRGALLVERDRYELGETVVLRARLADAQHKPLTDDSVTAQVLRPDGVTETAKLSAEADRPGMFVGQMNVLSEGTYEVSLALPDSNEEPLSRYLQVRVPDLERTHAERNEKLLASLAKETGGTYYAGFEAAIDGDGETRPLADAIASRAEVKLLKGAPDEKFAQAQMQWLLALVAGSLFLEWIVRRLNRLA